MSDLFADMAAEPDDFYDDASDDPSISGEGSRLYLGRCAGGPLDGQDAASRFPRGFLLVAMEPRLAWLYDYDDETRVFTARTDTPAELQDEGDDNRWRCADEGDFDIRVVEATR